MGCYNLVLRTIPSEKRRILCKLLPCFDEKEYAKRWADNTKPYEGIDLLLNKLATLRYKTAVFSNKPHEFTLLVVDKLLGNWNFDAVFGERPGIPIKPNPAGALEIAELFQIPPKEFLYLGDTDRYGYSKTEDVCGGCVGILKLRIAGNGADTLIKT